MATKIFVNLPVKDLNKSINFFKTLGYDFNEQYTDETAACLVISEDIYAMLLTHAKFKEFTPKEIADSAKTSEVLICITAPTKEKVNDIVTKAIGAGGAEVRQTQDYGSMYFRSFSDPDGHIWEIMWMDENTNQK